MHSESVIERKWTFLNKSTRAKIARVVLELLKSLSLSFLAGICYCSVQLNTAQKKSRTDNVEMHVKFFSWLENSDIF